MTPTAWLYKSKAPGGAEVITQQPPDRVVGLKEYDVTPLYAAEPKKTAAKARDDFLAHLVETLPPEQFAVVTHAADKLLDLVMKPSMLNAFTLVNAELAALHEEGNLSAPEIVRVGFPKL